MQNGVYFERDARAGPHSTIGKDSRLGINTTLGAYVEVHAFVSFGPLNQVKDHAKIGHNVTTDISVLIQAHAELRSLSTVGAYSIIDSFANVGGIIGPRVYFGEFTYAENVTVGEGARIYKRTYLPIGMYIGDNSIVFRTPDTAALFGFLRNYTLSHQ